MPAGIMQAYVFSARFFNEAAIESLETVQQADPISWRELPGSDLRHLLWVSIAQRIDSLDAAGSQNGRLPDSST